MSHENCSNRLAAPLTRKEFLKLTGMSMGALALGTLLTDVFAADAPAVMPLNLLPRVPPLPAKAKHVIHIFAGGAPSHLDTFDYKPSMDRFRDQTVGGLSGVIWPSPFKFEACGKGGVQISELFPNLRTVADDLCVIRSMNSEIPAHEPATKLLHTGSAILTKPCLGSWVLYGLGTESQNLPGFVSLGGPPEARQAAFLPGIYQGSQANFRANAPVNRVLPNLTNQFGSTEDEQRAQLDLAATLDAQHQKTVQGDEQLEARIGSFELAFRMQTAATDAFDITKESEATRAAYGKGDLAARLLCARRLVERGVRFVQIDAGGWDHHTNLSASIRKTSESIDQPAAALIKDLKARGMLDETLVIWGGEFGRTPNTPGRVSDASGRDHWSNAFCCWMAGGGVRGGMMHGETDDLGREVVKDPVHIHDLHATILRLLGFDHTKLTYRYNGRDFRLTDNYGKIVNQIIA